MSNQTELQRYLGEIVDPIDADATIRYSSTPQIDYFDVVAPNLGDGERYAIQQLGNAWADQRGYVATVRVGATITDVKRSPEHHKNFPIPDPLRIR